MDFKVKIYSAMPSTAKGMLTSGYIRLRKRRERRAAQLQALPEQGRRPRIVYLTGFPRSGTTMLKYYYGSQPGLRQTPFNPAGFHRTWAMAAADDGDEILVDKSNHYLYAFDQLFAAYGDAVRLCVIVRDPRDCIASFIHYHENREVPRTPAFWPYWAEQHANLARFARTSRFSHCVHIVRYEDLVRFPEQAKASYLQWLGFDIDAGDLDRHYEVQNPGESWHDSVFERREVGGHALQKWRSVKSPPAWAASLLPAWQDDPGATAMMQLFGYDAGGVTEPQLHGFSNVFHPTGKP